MQKSHRVRRFVISLGATAALLIPISVSQTQGVSVDVNDACANGACCREFNSVCQGSDGARQHYYEDADSRCGGAQRY